ncbi:hypothetical protein EJB05_32244 [Eragrostis curvula]|uniref:Neprosin activation peptide domain-containing protein n=1 Tax=Eragrostis curvula TaxID=38414 RepID=A0A5J9UGU2_9POAL|nr:hypothetical protein EJB05_32186 [Eragrostis curvula]TVU22537.1 hypothetical protein EJB05_32244 [Eragrostis curvula]
MEIKKSNYLIAIVFASLLLSAMAGGHRKLLNKDEAAGSMETSGSMQQLQEDDEVVVMVHKRILKHVKMDDYGRYDPTPTMAKPHFKDIPN